MIRNRLRLGAFTLVEMLVALAVLTLIVVFVGRLFTSATNVTVSGNKHMDCDLQARQFFDRFAIDLSQMLKRTDVDYYVKTPLGDPEKGNDHIAFFSHVPGYYPSTGSPSSVSLVAYRINSVAGSASLNRMERMGKGLPWNGASNGGGSPTALPLIFGLSTIYNHWPSATDNTSPDPDYETIGPQIFRFEYFYCLKTGNLSDTPGAAGLQDVAAISCCIAVIDSRSNVLLSSSQISDISSQMNDFSSSMKPRDLLAQWQATLDSNKALPRSAVSAIRLYQRTFNLLPKL